MKKKKRAKSAKMGPKLGFLPFSQVWLVSFPLHTVIACSNIEIKSTKKKIRSKFGQKDPKSDPKLGFLTFSQVGLISFP